ncbi:MAG: hypothetical protein Tsb0018_11540 [Opitutales bacterium]|tara:strand:+ start:4535 stop:5008 length:474 start_codon:yes stop_codon:yes gene_type:complete
MSAESINPKQKMIEEMAQQALQHQQESFNKGQAEQADVDEFQQGMSKSLPRGPVEGVGALRDPSLLGVKNINTPDGVTLGDAILDGIHKSSEVYRERVVAFRQGIQDGSLLKSGDFSAIPKLMQMQLDLMEFGLHQQVASKIAGKVSSGIQTIFRNQ